MLCTLIQLETGSLFAASSPQTHEEDRLEWKKYSSKPTSLVNFRYYLRVKRENVFQANQTELRSIYTCPNI